MGVRHKIEQWIPPAEPKYYKRSKKKNWRVEGKYTGPPKKLWFLHGGIRILGKYATRRDAERAIEKVKNSRFWSDYQLEIKHIKTKKSS